MAKIYKGISRFCLNDSHLESIKIVLDHLESHWSSLKSSVKFSNRNATVEWSSNKSELDKIQDMSYNVDDTSY